MPKSLRIAQLCAALVVTSLGGCQGPGPIQWRVSPGAGLETREVNVFAELRAGGCDGSPTFLSRVGASGATAAPRLEAGVWGVAAWVTDAECRRIGFVCDELTLPSGEPVFTSIVAPITPEPAGCEASRCFCGECDGDPGCAEPDAGRPDAGTQDGDTPRDAGRPPDVGPPVCEPELCNGLDDDCDGRVDEDGDRDGAPVCQDCDDDDPARSTLHREICGNDVDENCSGGLDEGCCDEAAGMHLVVDAFGRVYCSSEIQSAATCAPMRANCLQNYVGCIASYWHRAGVVPEPITECGVRPQNGGATATCYYLSEGGGSADCQSLCGTCSLRYTCNSAPLLPTSADGCGRDEIRMDGRCVPVAAAGRARCCGTADCGADEVCRLADGTGANGNDGVGYCEPM